MALYREPGFLAARMADGYLVGAFTSEDTHSDSYSTSTALIWKPEFMAEWFTDSGAWINPSDIGWIIHLATSRESTVYDKNKPVVFASTLEEAFGAFVQYANEGDTSGQGIARAAYILHHKHGWLYAYDEEARHNMDNIIPNPSSWRHLNDAATYTTITP